MSLSKNDLTALHGLMYETAKYLDKKTDMELDQGYLDYQRKDIAPRYIHRSKSEHEEAVQHLSTTIVISISEENSEYELMLEEKP